MIGTRRNRWKKENRERMEAKENGVMGTRSRGDRDHRTGEQANAETGTGGRRIEEMPRYLGTRWGRETFLGKRRGEGTKRE